MCVAAEGVGWERVRVDGAHVWAGDWVGEGVCCVCVCVCAPGWRVIRWTTEFETVTH